MPFAQYFSRLAEWSTSLKPSMRTPLDNHCFYSKFKEAVAQKKVTISLDVIKVITSRQLSKGRESLVLKLATISIHSLRNKIMLGA